MCRLLFYKGVVNDKLTSLIDLIKKASEHDPFLEKASSNKRNSHSDGWGYVIYHNNTITYYKTTTPIYRDSVGLKNLLYTLSHFSNKDRIFILHTRAASEGSVNIINTQPIKYATLSTEFYLVHNGTMNKEKLACDLGLTSVETSISDTYLMGFYISSRLKVFEQVTLLKIFRELAKYTRTAFNTITLFLPITSETPISIITSYYTTQDPRKIEYYKLYIEEKEDYIAYYSSTIYHLSKTKDATPLPNNTIHIIKEHEGIHKEKLA